MALIAKARYNRSAGAVISRQPFIRAPVMEHSELWHSVVRIFQHDHLAIGLTGFLVAFQFILYRWFWRRSTRPLLGAISAVNKLAGNASRQEKARQVAAESYGQLSEAWRSVFDGNANDPAGTDNLAPEDAFNSTTLLPIDYNARLDAGAPGVFTAIGIIGTFLGLILGFLRVSPTDATASIQPLIGAMVVAFVNSLVGVTLSIIWSVGSRRRRHSFNAACERLISVAHNLRPNLSFEWRLLRQLEALTAATLDSQHMTRNQLGIIASNLESLQGQTRESSQALL
jgi:hypothetical protein